MEKILLATGLDNYETGLQLEVKKITGGDDARSYSDHIAANCDEREIILLFSELMLNTNNIRTDLLGIEVLKWLRIKHKINNSIILLGFMELSQILQTHPEHIIITAPGVHYMRLPATSYDLKQIILKCKPIKNIKEVHKKFVQADFKIQHFGHQFANELGCFKISKEIERIFNVADFLDQELLEKNLDWYKLQMLYEKGDDLAVNSIKESVMELRTVLKARKVIYIDDKGDAGWFKIIDFLLYEDHNSFTKRKEIYYGSKQINSLLVSGFNQFASHIVHKNPSLVLLDLRLKGIEEIGLKIEKNSGAKLLKEIKRLRPELPVLILSATNKIHSLEILSKYPYFSSDLWTKPRIEEGLSITKSLEKLVEKIVEVVSINDKPAHKFITKATYINSQQLCTLVENIHTFDYILFDTNFFCESNNAKHYGKFLKCFDTLIENHELRSKVVLIEDVISELFINSFKKHTDKLTGEDTTALVNGIASNSIKKIIQVLTTKDIENFRDKVSRLLDSNIHYQVYDYRGKWAVARCRDIIINKFINETTAIKEKERLELEENHFKSLVYADNVFKYLIKLLSITMNKKVLFVSDDLLCKREISVFYQNFKSSEHFKINRETGEVKHSNSVFLNEILTVEGNKKIPGLQMVKNSFFSTKFFRWQQK